MKNSLTFLSLRVGAMLVVSVVLGWSWVVTRAAQSETAPRSATHSRAQVADTETTEIRVHVIARGGKYLGDDVGGALVTIRDARTHEFLASGVTKGGSGLADLMTIERARTTPLPTQDASVFTTTLKLAEPRLLEFEAFGPLAAQGSANRVTSTEWVLPQSFVPHGNAVTLELAGLNVDALSPPTHFLPKDKPPITLDVGANVTMMCGCPIGPNLPWDPKDFQVVMLVKRPDGKTDTVDLEFDANALDHAPSQFIARYEAKLSGIYEAIIMAHESKYGNSGSDRVTFIVP